MLPPSLRCMALSVSVLISGAATGCDDGDRVITRLDIGVGRDQSLNDAGGVDMGVPSDQGPDLGPLELARYTDDRTQSPITRNVARELRAIAARDAREGDRFIKVGASATQSSSFMRCFAGANVDLGARDDLQGTLEHFRASMIGADTSYDRDSQAALFGQSAGWALAGDPSPLAQEVGAVDPRYAVVMYGTNDLNQGGSVNAAARLYADSMLNLTDALANDGIIPILTTIMPRESTNAPERDAFVPLFNLILRAIAQSRQVPLIDFHRELTPLTDSGLSGDGIHPSTFSGGACVLTAEALSDGYNIRNLLTLDALDRARSVVDGDPMDPAPDTALTVRGSGSPADPFVVEGLPFVHHGNTLFSTHDRIDAYPSCDAGQDESGPEIYYRIDLATSTEVSFFVFDRGSADIDVHVAANVDGSSCAGRSDSELTLVLGAGTHFITLDTFVGASEFAGEFVFGAYLP